MKNLVIILTVLVIILLGVAGYFIYHNQIVIKQLTKGASPSPAPATSQPQATTQASPTSTLSPLLTLATTQNAIKTNINAKNYQGLTAYMTDPVNVILQASECCGPKTPAEAIDQMSYINTGVPFDFDQENSTIKNLKAKNPQLADKFIGISKGSEYLVSFGINSENKISDILMSVSWKLFSY